MTLPDELAQWLHEVTQGKPFPWVWLATSDPHLGAQVRTVRVLSFNLRQGCFTFASHSGHAKHAQIGHDPRGQLCLLRNEPLLQVRLDVRLTTTPGVTHPVGARLWQKLAAPQKRLLYGAHPQAPQPPPTFTLVDAETVGADLLRLADDGGSRCRFVCKAAEGWSRQSMPL